MITINRNKNGSRFVYMFFFLGSCFVFWWLPSVVYRVLLDYPDPVLDPALTLSFYAVVSFVTGYVLTASYNVAFFRSNTVILERTARVSKWLTVLFGIPSFFLALEFFLYRATVDYGRGEGIPLLYQAFFYPQMSFFFLYITTTPDKELKPKVFWALVALSIGIRLIVSLKWGRFFVGQIIFAFFIVALARGWLRITPTNMLKLLLAGVFVFAVPAITRGDFDASKKTSNDNPLVEFVAAGSTLKLFQDNTELDLTDWCNPLFVSLSAKTVPFKALDVCTIDIWGEFGLPATLDRILAYNEIGAKAMDVLNGPGSNYMLELYVSLGREIGVIVGSFFFGMSCAFSYNALQFRTIYGSIWLEILSRAIFAPRSNLGYVFERLPSLYMTTIIVAMGASLIFRVKRSD